ncbi:MAG TPA: class I SAM-dependent methyltransferase [Terracidiphilus sp.]|nr:class I SAM-dependent methyltransferase [Terracidiphilus sp.]
MTVQTTETELAEFEKYAPTYSELLDDPARNRFAQDPLHFHWRKWILIERFLRERGLIPGSLTWLDVGCGRGELLALGGGNFRRAVGCDPSYGMLPSDSPFRVYEQRSLTKLPFDDRSFDLVSVVCVMHHVHGNHRQELMNDIQRVLRPGGLCCLIEHNPWNPVTRTIVKRCPVDIDAQLQSAREIKRLVDGSGLRCVHLEYFLYLPESAYQRFGAFEKLFSKSPLGGQYALFAQVPA